MGGDLWIVSYSISCYLWFLTYVVADEIYTPWMDDRHLYFMHIDVSLVTVKGLYIWGALGRPWDGICHPQSLVIQRKLSFIGACKVYGMPWVGESKDALWKSSGVEFFFTSRWNSCKQNKQGANNRPVNQTPSPEGEKLHSDSGISVDSQSLHDQPPQSQTASMQGKGRRGFHKIGRKANMEDQVLDWCQSWKTSSGPFPNPSPFATSRY